VTTSGTKPSGGSAARNLLIALAVMGAILMIVEMIRDPVPEGYAKASEAREADGAAPTYLGWRGLDRASNAERYLAAFREIDANAPDLMSFKPPSEEERAAALEARTARRAFDMAPPTIPHPVDQLEYPGCLTCHEKGARIGDGTLVATPMSHRVLSNCLQCHVVQRDSAPGEALEATVALETSFAGLEPATSVAPATPGAPPVIPHTTWMRERCASCHGGYAEGLRSGHPYRQNCEQCHTPSAVLDQRPVVVLGDGSRSAE